MLLKAPVRTGGFSEKKEGKRHPSDERREETLVGKAWLLTWSERSSKAIDPHRGILKGDCSRERTSGKNWSWLRCASSGRSRGGGGPYHSGTREEVRKIGGARKNHREAPESTVGLGWEASRKKKRGNRVPPWSVCFLIWIGFRGALGRELINKNRIREREIVVGEGEDPSQK